jgi:large subunit ribosomal protein L24
MARIRKGDLVVVRSGADKGKRGKVLRVISGGSDDAGREQPGKAIVEGVRMLFKHLKKSQKHPQGGRIQREGPVPLSILMPVDPTTDAGTRVAFRVEDGKKVRVGRKSGAVLVGAVKGGRKETAKTEGAKS